MAPRARQICFTSKQDNDSSPSKEHHRGRSVEKTGDATFADQANSTPKISRQNDAAAIFNALSKLSAAYFRIDTNSPRKESDSPRKESDSVGTSRLQSKNTIKPHDAPICGAQQRDTTMNAHDVNSQGAENPPLDVTPVYSQELPATKQIPAEQKQQNGKSEPLKSTQQTNTTRDKSVVSSQKKLSLEAQERAVPASRWGRAFQFTSLAAGLGMGALGKCTCRDGPSRHCSTVLHT